jgi:hypothetical protein
MNKMDTVVDASVARSEFCTLSDPLGLWTREQFLIDPMLSRVRMIAEVVHHFFDIVVPASRMFEQDARSYGASTWTCVHSRTNRTARRSSIHPMMSMSDKSHLDQRRDMSRRGGGT